ncbi:MAG: OmpA family protein [Flavitalea sp.]
MKKIVLLILSVSLFTGLKAQLLKRLGDRAKQKVEQKMGDKVDKGIDDAADGKKSEKNTKKETSPSTEKSEPAGDSQSGGAASSSDGTSASSEPPSLKTYSKFDFVPGDKLLVYENFDADAIGDFPDKWNTNSSGEIVTLNGRDGKWLKIRREGIFHPEFITSLPDNFTLEFDMGVNNGFNFYSTELFMTFADLAKPEEFSKFGRFPRYNGKHVVRFTLHSTEAGNKTGQSDILTTVDGSPLISNHVSVNEFNFGQKNIIHVSIWRQKQRVRFYVNNEKIWDVPKAFDADGKYNSLIFATGGFHKEEDFYVLANLRLAVGAPDTRNKLITEGKFVTHGILFDVNSEQIKPESYGSIKDIANVLSENAGVKVKIVGHTDSDGDDKSNLELSKKRAESVKNALVKEFSIDASRIETDGKGESQPIDKSETVVGKANNRRVEFIKL